jgi:hypothetical protein
MPPGHRVKLQDAGCPSHVAACRLAVWEVSAACVDDDGQAPVQAAETFDAS